MILVTGATGFVGRHLVPKLAAAGEPVRVLIPAPKGRRPRPHPWVDNPQVEVFEGSIFQPEQLHRAMTGVHTVFHLASAQWWGGRRDLEFIDVGGTQNVAISARSARIGRLFVLSHIGAEPSAGFSLLRAKGQVEDIVRKSGIAYTIFRCGILYGPEDRFVNNLAMLLKFNPLVVLQPGKGEGLLHPLYIDDLTQALVNALENLDLVDATVEIGGTEYISYNEMLRTVMRVSGSSRTVITVPPYVLRGLTRAMRRIFAHFPMTPQWFDLVSGNRTADLSNLYNYTGVRPRRFEDTLLTYMPERRYGFELMRYLLRRRPRPRF